MDEVECIASKVDWNPRSRSAGTGIASDFSAVFERYIDDVGLGVLDGFWRVGFL